MGETVRRDVAGRHFLQPVVADRRRGAQRFVGVARFELHTSGLQPSARGSGMSPHTRETVRLELEPNRELVRFGWIRLRELSHARVRAEQVLDVVAELVREHVGLREIPTCAQALLQLLEESEVEIDLLILRTVERPGGRLREAAAARPATA